jgi:hypothetical protein
VSFLYASLVSVEGDGMRRIGVLMLNAYDFPYSYGGREKSLKEKAEMEAASAEGKVKEVVGKVQEKVQEKLS